MPQSTEVLSKSLFTFSSFLSRFVALTLVFAVTQISPQPSLAQIMNEQDKALSSIEELISQDKFQDAIREYSKLIERSPQAKLYILRGSTQILAQDYVAALNDFRLALKAAQKDNNPELQEVARIYIIDMESVVNSPK